MNTPLEPRRFRSTVPFYARYRLAYPETLLRRVWDFVGMKANDGVLDLGCGPGVLTVPFAKMGARVTAIDPEPDMIAATEAAVEAAGVSVEIWQASSFAMPDGIGPFRLVTMGRSFHWTDRAKTLRTLDHLVSPGGGVASLGDTVIRSSETAWRDEWLKIMDDYGGSMRERRIENGVFRADEALLLESRFSRLTRISTLFRREIDTDEVLDRKSTRLNSSY